MEMLPAILMLAVLFVGIAAGYLFRGFRVTATLNQMKAGYLTEQAGFTERLAGRESQIAELREFLDDGKKSTERLLVEVRQESGLRAAAEAKLEATRLMADEKLQVLEQAQAQLMTNFQALAADALKNNNHSFLDLAGQTLSRYQQSAQADLEGRQNQISAVLAPIKESLDKVDALRL